MQTPWSHHAVREEFDEEIRLLILALYEAAAEETKGQMHVDIDGEAQPLDHARQLALWSVAGLYAPWMAAPVDPRTLITHATRHFEALQLHCSQMSEKTPQEEETGVNLADVANEIDMLNALACASSAKVPGARDSLERLLADHDLRWWEPRYGLVMEEPRGQNRPTLPHLKLGSNVAAIGTYLLVSEVTEQRIWIDRARSIAYALYRELPVATLKDHFALILATGEEVQPSSWAGSTDGHMSRHLTAPLGIDEAVAVYFLWVRNLLHLRASLIEEGEEAPEWMLAHAWEIYQWVRSRSWRGDGQGFSASILPTMAEQESETSFSPFVEAVSAAEALGKTLEHIGGDADWLSQLSEDFAATMTWADKNLRHAPGEWSSSPALAPRSREEGEEEKPSVKELSEVLYALAAPLMLARLPLAPSIPTALAQGCVAPWTGREGKG